MNTIERFLGSYEGTGSWHDAAGKSASYRIRQTNAARGEGFEIAFHHDFDDGTAVDARVLLAPIAANLFRVEAGGAAIGNGYVFDACCHYHLKIGDKFVEASYRASGSELEVFGSSTSNAEGLYIAWTERLRRTP